MKILKNIYFFIFELNYERIFSLINDTRKLKQQDHDK